MRHPLLIAAFMLPFLSVTAQMSGIYTVGGANPDFPNPTAVVSALQSQGVSGPVTIQIRPGSYGGFTLFGVPGLTADRPLVFESETGDSSSVVLRTTTLLKGVNYVTLHNLTMKAGTTGQQDPVLHIVQSDHIVVEHCDIRNIPPSNYFFGDGLIKAEYEYSGVQKSCRIRYCNIVSDNIALVVRGDHGKVALQWNKMQGGVDFWTGTPSDMDHCDVFLPLGYDSFINDFRFGNISGNKIDSDNPDFLRVYANKFWNNQVLSGVDLGNCNDVMGNTFYKKATCTPFGNPFGASYNDFRAGIDFDYCYGCNIIGNKFHKPVNMSFCDGSLFTSNFVYDTLIITHGPDYEIFHNNFAAGSYFEMDYTGGAVKYNSFSNLFILQPSITEIKGNNYIPGSTHFYSAYFDPIPSFYDPVYADNKTDLHASNPVLAGKGAILGINWYYKKDIDGVARPARTSIGANEICMGPQLPDTIHLICGDSVLLQRCSVQPGSHWTPAAVLSHPNATRPVAHPMQSVNLYLRDSSENILDSVFIQVAPFTTHPSRHYYSLCGYTGVIGTLLPPNASVHWEPAAGLDNPNLPNPTVTFSDTMFYVAYIDMPNCGVLTDTVFLNIDQKPLANAYYFESNPCEITFFNYSTCADELHWYFGDGDSSNVYAPVHIYPGPGIYPVRLLISNPSGVDSFAFQVYVSCTVNTNSPREIPAIKVMPDPARDYITIDLAAFPSEILNIGLYNMAGVPVLQQTMNGGQPETIEISRLPAGMYLIEITGAGGPVWGRFVKVKG